MVEERKLRVTWGGTGFGEVSVRTRQSAGLKELHLNPERGRSRVAMP